MIYQQMALLFDTHTVEQAAQELNINPEPVRDYYEQLRQLQTLSSVGEVE